MVNGTKKFVARPQKQNILTKYFVFVEGGEARTTADLCFCDLDESDGCEHSRSNLWDWGEHTDVEMGYFRWGLIKPTGRKMGFAVDIY